MGPYGVFIVVAILALVLAVVAGIIKEIRDVTYFMREIDMTTIAMFFLGGVIAVIGLVGAVTGVF